MYQINFYHIKVEVMFWVNTEIYFAVNLLLRYV